MDTKAVEELAGLFAKSPGLAVLVALAGFVAWFVKVGALGFVSRQKDKRRERVFDTYEKLKEMGGLTEADRESLLGELRGAGVGLPSQLVAESQAKNLKRESVVRLPLGLEWLEWGSRIVMSAFIGVMMGAMVAFLLGGVFAGGWMIFASGGDPVVVVTGLFFVGFGLWGTALIGGDALRKLVNRFPQKLAFLEGWMKWLARKTETARALGYLGISVVSRVGTVVALLFYARLLVVEFGGAPWAWWTAICLGLLGAAFGVRFAVAGIHFLGIFEVDPDGESGA